MAGQPKKFNKTNFQELVFEYLETIYQKQTNKEKEMPTFYGFFLFAREKYECSYRSIRRCFDEYWPEMKKDFKNIRADLLVRGAGMGNYNVAMSIFALKNWCDWKENPQDSINSEELNENIKTLAELINNPMPNRDIYNIDNE